MHTLNHYVYTTLYIVVHTTYSSRLETRPIILLGLQAHALTITQILGNTDICQ